MQHSKETAKTIISGRVTLPGNVTTASRCLDVMDGSFIPKYVFKVNTKRESKSLLRINRQLSGDYSEVAPDTRGGDSDKA